MRQDRHQRTATLTLALTLTLCLAASWLLAACDIAGDRGLPSGATPEADAGLIGDGHAAAPDQRAPVKLDAAPIPPPPPPKGPTQALDVLFVIDNSGSMAEEQQALAAAFPQLIADLRDHRLGADGSGRPCSALDRAGCRLPDLRVGVISTDLGAGAYSLPSCEVTGGDDGKLQRTPRVAGCTPPSDPWISFDPNSGLSNVPAGDADHALRIAEAFSCIAKLGISGCGFESPLEAARRALDPKLGRNPGFLRPGARLLVVFIGDEDDCSAKNAALYDPSQQAMSDPLGPLTSYRCFEFGVTCDVNDRAAGPRSQCKPTAGGMLHDVTGYVSFLRGLKPQPGEVQLAGLVGPTTPVVVTQQGSGTLGLAPSCSGPGGSATPPLRLASVIDQLGGKMTSICDADYGPAMSTIARLVQR